MNIELHPTAVHFPISLFTLYYLYQIFTVIKPELIPKHLNLWILIPVALSTLPAIISGEKAKQSLTELCDETREIIANHELFANITTWGTMVLTVIWIYLTLKGYAGQRVQHLLLAFLTLIFISVCIKGYLGGELLHVWDI